MNVKNKTIKITPYLLAASLLIAWLVTQERSSNEINKKKNSASDKAYDSDESVGESALKNWLSKKNWSYFLHVNETQCMVLVSRPKTKTYSQTSTNTDQACQILLQTLKAL